jgi:hypothetical protein
MPNPKMDDHQPFLDHLAAAVERVGLEYWILGLTCWFRAGSIMLRSGTRW